MHPGRPPGWWPPACAADLLLAMRLCVSTKQPRVAAVAGAWLTRAAKQRATQLLSSSQPSLAPLSQPQGGGWLACWTLARRCPRFEVERSFLFYGCRVAATCARFTEKQASSAPPPWGKRNLTADGSSGEPRKKSAWLHAHSINMANSKAETVLRGIPTRPGPCSPAPCTTGTSRPASSSRTWTPTRPGTSRGTRART
jgi:hypothetical protein